MVAAGRARIYRCSKSAHTSPTGWYAHTADRRGRGFHQLAYIGNIHSIQEQIAKVWIVGHARPVHRAQCAGKQNRQFRSPMDIRPSAFHAAFSSKKVSTEFFLLRCDRGNFIGTEAVASPTAEVSKEKAPSASWLLLEFRWEGSGVLPLHK